MNTSSVQNPPAHRSTFTSFALATFVLLASSLPAVRADDVPDRDRRAAALPALVGMYQVAASTDPFFPVGTRREWFLDFGKGVSSGKNSGTVAVSLRENPNVKVRIMVWQIFPQTGRLYLGNPFSEGSRQAVSVADWEINDSRGGVVLERNGYQIVLQKADPRNY